MKSEGEQSTSVLSCVFNEVTAAGKKSFQANHYCNFVRFFLANVALVVAESNIARNAMNDT